MTGPMTAAAANLAVPQWTDAAFVECVMIHLGINNLLSLHKFSDTYSNPDRTHSDDWGSR